VTMQRSGNKFPIIALGVAFEHLDVMLASLLASSIVNEFVGSDSDFKLLYAYIGYAIAFLFRPFGAFCFGCMGDLYGRKTSLIASMTLMSGATLALAFIPGVHTLGVASSILFFVCRIAQGLAVGGEYGTAMTYAYEFNPNYRTFFGACVIASTHLGGLCASILAVYFAGNFRFAFLAGGLTGCFILLFRSCIKEDSVTPSIKIGRLAKESVKNKKGIVEALIVASMLVLCFYGSLIYLNELIHQDLGIPRSEIFKSNALLLVLWAILPPVLGFVADKFAICYRKMMRIGALGVLFSSPLLGAALALKSYPAIVAAQIVMHLFHMAFCLCTPRFFGDLFAGQARNTTISTTYSIGASCTAALAPMICHVSIALFHTKFAICIPFIVIAMASIVVLKKEDICKETILLNSTT